MVVIWLDRNGSLPERLFRSAHALKPDSRESAHKPSTISVSDKGSFQRRGRWALMAKAGWIVDGRLWTVDAPIWTLALISGVTMSSKSVDLRQIELLDDEIAPLVIEAEGEGHHFMRRLEDEWHSGSNRFRGNGEFLLSAHVGGRLVAVGGLNRDPYSLAEGVGRLRHVYVSFAARRQGVGTVLVRRILADAEGSFSILRLRATTAEAAAFYERLGFQNTNEEAATHLFKFRTS